MSKFSSLIPLPGKNSVNTGKRSCPTKLLVSRHGMPSEKLTSVCKFPTNPYWSKRMITRDVGPFSVTGFDKFIELLIKANAEIKKQYPELYKVMGTAGCLCVRHVRGNPGSLSNHGLGMAVDIKIDGVLSPYGGSKMQAGLLDIYRVYKTFDIFWGVNFKVSDAMHFEASDVLVKKWISEGKL